jgi:hypothetical protein
MCKTRDDCSGHGDCSITAKGISCACDAGFAGDHCEAVSTWAALENLTAGCTIIPGVENNCSFELAKDFTTPLTGFKTIIIGDHGTGSHDDDDVHPGGDSKDPVYIIIDGKGMAVIDAHYQDRFFHIHPDSTLSLIGVTLQNGKEDVGVAIQLQQ